MSWAATIVARDGLVEFRMTRDTPPVQMCPEVARKLAATLLVVAELAEGGDTSDEQESVSDG